MKTGRKNHSRLKRPVGLFVLLSPLLVGTYLLSGKIMASRVECYTQYGPCQAKYLEEINFLQNLPLLRTLPETQVQSRLEKFTEVRQVSLYRRLPQTLVVSLMLRKPLGTIGPAVLGTRYVSDTEGVILDESDNQNLPYLVSDNNLAIGEKISGGQVLALELLAKISQIAGRPVSGSLAENSLTIFLPNDQKVLFDLKYLPQNWYATLQVILERSKIASKIPKIIDLRFSDPVITF